jgi:hypothetical protein
MPANSSSRSLALLAPEQEETGMLAEARLELFHSRAPPFPPFIIQRSVPKPLSIQG